MTKIKVIGLTGGIASGKSTVANIFRNLGIIVIDADEIAHQIIEPGNQGYFNVKEEFGTAILTADGFINRKELGKIIFRDHAARVKLEQITHPAILARINELITFYASQNQKIIVVEAPLLFEAGMENQFDYIWVVSADPDLQVQRLMERNQISRREAEQRLRSQMPTNEKEAKADVIIYNNRDLVDLESMVIRLVDTLIRKDGLD